MIGASAIEKALFGPMNVVLKNTLIERKDLTMIMDAPPRFVQAFCRPVRSSLTKPQFHHLWTLVLGILLNLRRAKLNHLAGALPGHTHRTAHGVFLSRSDWDAAGLLDAELDHLLRRMKPRRGEVIYLVIDDTRIPKRGRKMCGVSKIWDHSSSASSMATSWSPPRCSFAASRCRGRLRCGCRNDGRVAPTAR